MSWHQGIFTKQFWTTLWWTNMAIEIPPIFNRRYIFKRYQKVHFNCHLSLLVYVADSLNIVWEGATTMCEGHAWTAVQADSSQKKRRVEKWWLSTSEVVAFLNSLRIQTPPKNRIERSNPIRFSLRDDNNPPLSKFVIFAFVWWIFGC